MKKRVLSILLVMLMVLSLLPTTALAGTPVFQIDDTGTNTTKKFDALDSTAMSYIKYDCTGAVSITLLDDYNIPDTIDFQGQVLELNLFGHKLYGKVENAENVTVINSTKTKGKLAATGTYKSVETELVDTAYTLTPGTYTATVSEKGETPYTITYYDTYSATDVKAYGGTERTGSAVATAPVNPGDSVKLISGDKVTDIKKTVNTSDTVKAAGFSGWTIDGVPYKVGDSFAPTGTTKDIKVMAAYAPYYTVQYCVTSPIDGTTHKDYYASVLKGESTTLYGAAASSVSGFTGYTLSGWKTVEGNTLTPGESYTPSESLVVLEAVFVQNTCKIKYVNDKDAEITAITQKPATVGATIQLSGVSGLKPAATGHADCSYCVFTGWQLVGTLTTIDAGGNYTVSASDIVDGVITFKATWKHVDPAKTYTVNYQDKNGNGLTDLSGKTYTAGTAIKLAGTDGMEVPTDSVFAGWFLASTGNKIDAGGNYTVDAQDAKTGVITFKATWDKVNTCTIKYYLDQAAYDNSKKGTKGGFGADTVTAGTTINLLDESDLSPTLIAKKSGYTFKGWMKAVGTNIDTNVTYDCGEEYTVDSNVCFVGLWEAIPETPEYTVTYYRDWDEYNYNKATATKYEDACRKVDEGTVVELWGDAAQNILSVDFLYWYNPATNKTYEPGETFPVNSNTDFIAIYKSDKLYKVTYDLDGGTYKDDLGYTVYSIEKLASEDAAVVVENDVALNITKPGYTFKGWSYGGKLYKADGSADGGYTYFTMPGKAVTLTAMWQQNKPYKVSYNFNGGKFGTNTSFDVAAYDGGEQVDILATAPTKKGCNFVGWKSTALDPEKVYANDAANIKGAEDYFMMPKMDVELVAQWETKATYTVNYALAGGIYVDNEGVTHSAIDSADYEEKAVVVVNFVELKNGDLVFMGWRNSVDGQLYDNVTYKKFAMPAADVTLTAEWASQHTVSFDLNLPANAKASAANKDKAYVAYPDSNGDETKDTVLADQTKIVGETVTPVEDPKSYVVFDDNGGYTTYYFAGWTTVKDDANTLWNFNKPLEDTDFEQYTGSLTLIAKWSTEQHYKVVFNLNVPVGAKATDDHSKAYVAYPDNNGAETKATKLADQIKVAGDKLTNPGKPASYVVKNSDGAYTTYTFDGWTVNGDESNIWNFDKALQASDIDDLKGILTLTAKWTADRHYTVVFKDKITDELKNGKDTLANTEAAQFIVYNNDQLYDYYGTDGKYNDTKAAALTLKDVSESEVIPYDTQATGGSDYPAFTRVDYTLGDSDSNYVNDWYVVNNADQKVYYYDVTKSLAENCALNGCKVEDLADANGVITFWANWNYKYNQLDNGTYQVEITTNDATNPMEKGTYGEYYSDYIEATTDHTSVTTGAKGNIYRNFYLTNEKGYGYGDGVTVSELPDGLYLNKLTGEIYGVPKETGTFTFYVRMEGDTADNAKWISDVKAITITIDALPISADRIDNKANIYDKTYGDTDAAAYNKNDANQGQTYVSNNLTITLGKDNTPLATSTRKAIDGELANVEMITSTTDQKVTLNFAYTNAYNARVAQINKGKDPTNSAWLKSVDLQDVALKDIFANFNDTVTFPVVRTEGEDAGSYKLYLTEDKVTYEYGDAATKANAKAEGFKAVYDLTIPEAFASKVVDENAAQYVFTINPVTLTLSLNGKDYTKTYGENDPVYPTSDLTTAATDNTTAGQAATAVTKSASTTLTIKYPMGFTDTLVVAPTRDFGEDVKTGSKDYKLYLTNSDISTSATDKADKNIAHEREDAAVKANYTFVLGGYTNNTLTINKRSLTFAADSSSYTYGTLKPSDVLTGTFAGLADNESIGVVDKAVASIVSTPSTAGYLKAGDYTQTLADDRQISFDITNTLWSDETGAQNATKLADTAGNYNATASLKVAKADTLKVTGNIVKVQKGTKPSLDNIKALATLSGVLTNGDKKDDVTLNVKGYSAYINGDSVSGGNAQEFVAALANKLTAGLTDDLTVTVTYEVSGADKDNYVIPTAPTVTGTLQVYTASSSGGGGGGGGGGSASYKVDVDETTHGDATPDHSSASSGTKVTIDVDPDKGYTVDTVTVKNSKDKEIELTKKSDTEYTFIMPSGNVTVSATFAEDDDMSNYFVDVNKGDYDYDAVFWAIRKGITEGTDATHFSPDWTCTRGQIVTFLWRAAGSPEPAGTDNPFVDVASSSYYAKAVQWASENGIAKGTTTTTFEPNLTCTRAQCVAFIARALGAKDATGSVSFTDVPSGAWYEGYVAWAVKNGITEGIGGGLFGPDQNCTRGQIVTFLYRAYLD